MLFPKLYKNNRDYFFDLTPDASSIADPWKTFSEIFESPAKFPPLMEATDGYSVSIDLPGVAESDIDITLVGNRLRLNAKRRNNSKIDVGVYSLPSDSDLNNIEADLSYGVLTITVPKQPEHKQRKILIKRKE